MTQNVRAHVCKCVHLDLSRIVRQNSSQSFVVQSSTLIHLPQPVCLVLVINVILSKFFVGICLQWIDLLLVHAFRASSSKRKVPDNLWLNHYRIIGNQISHGMCVKRVHCTGVLKMHVELVLASSLTSGGSLSCLQKAAINVFSHSPTSSICEGG